MKREKLKQLIAKPTRRMRFLGVASLAIVAISFFAYYFAVVSPSRANAFSGGGEGSSTDPYLVSTCSQLQEINSYPSRSFFVGW